MKKLLLIDNYDSFTYNLAQILEEHGAYSLSIKKHDQINIQEVEEFDKIVFSPGPGLPDDFPIIKQILKIHSPKKSILGVCLGHQAIAEFFGGKLSRFTSVVHGISKTARIIERNHYLFQNLPDSIRVGLYHSWYVNSEFLPVDIKVSMLSEDGVIMAISHKTYDVNGIQFHPESIMTTEGKQILNNWLNQSL